MTFWDFLDRRWPTERGWVTMLLAALIASLLKMADHNPELWKVELFKTLLTAAVITGALNMVLAFHFTANKSDETKSQNTGKLADAFRSVAENAASTTIDSAAQIADAADKTAQAAQHEADRIRETGEVDGAEDTFPMPPADEEETTNGT